MGTNQIIFTLERQQQLRSLLLAADGGWRMADGGWQLVQGGDGRRGEKEKRRGGGLACDGRRAVRAAAGVDRSER